MDDAMIRAFRADLTAFQRDDVEGKGVAVLQEAASTAAEAIVIGNEYGPGTPLDTGFLRSSFRVSQGAPIDGPSEPPPTPAGRKPGDAPIYFTPLDLTAAETVPLGSEVYVTTAAEYAAYLEEEPMVRRHGPPENVGGSTQFIAPVEQRWPAILEDAARRVGYGE